MLLCPCTLWSSVHVHVYRQQYCEVLAAKKPLEFCWQFVADMVQDNVGYALWGASVLVGGVASVGPQGYPTVSPDTLGGTTCLDSRAAGLGRLRSRVLGHGRSSRWYG